MQLASLLCLPGQDLVFFRCCASLHCCFGLHIRYKKIANALLPVRPSGWGQLSSNLFQVVVRFNWLLSAMLPKSAFCSEARINRCFGNMSSPVLPGVLTSPFEPVHLFHFIIETAHPWPCRDRTCNSCAPCLSGPTARPPARGSHRLMVSNGWALVPFHAKPQVG